MRCSIDRRARASCCKWILAWSIAGLLFVAAPEAYADESQAGKVVAIEEDWELVVKEPDQETQAPQVTCIIAPTTSDNGVFAAFNLNHKSFPQYEAGGLHLQLWNDGTPLASAKFPSDQLLKTPNEVVTWTTRMSLLDGQLTFEIVSGSSETWGDFGDTGNLKAAVATELEDLNQYESAYSAANSGVGFAGNRVTSLKLKALRKLLLSGDVIEDNNARTVHPHN